MEFDYRNLDIKGCMKFPPPLFLNSLYTVICWNFTIEGTLGGHLGSL